MNRDVRTLLFCKITPDDESFSYKSSSERKNHRKIYADISAPNPKEEHNKKTFFAFGGFDALCVYSNNSSDNNPDWLHDIYADKQRIIGNISPNVIFHPMHLVSHRADLNTFWDETSDLEFPFFMTTLVYGVNHEDHVSLRPGECSMYEHSISDHLKRAVGSSNKNIRYAVYNGISISDVVVLWRVKDIRSALDVVSSIERCGVARKTLTTLSFPLGPDGRILDCVYDRLISMAEDKITLSIHGSVRDMNKFQIFRDMLSKKRNAKITRMLRASGKICVLSTRDWQCALPQSNYSINLGKNDFTIAATVSFANVAQLLELYYEAHELITDACWEIITDFRVSGEDRHGNLCVAANKPSDILGHVYRDFLSNYHNDNLDLKRFPWSNAMLELLGTHYYIDRHPVLHGPSYLIYKSIKIANAYFAGGVEDFDNEINRKALLKKSESGILEFIDSWDQLTEQITRNDDAVLNNRSNTHTIHFSLPESALDFYHAFLRRIVDYLVEYDAVEGRKPAHFEYDFLLSPRSSERFCFTAMFETDLSFRPTTNLEHHTIWPAKQAYILKLPLESVFCPMEICIPAVHECFHCFGDTLRNRNIRKYSMATFVAAVLINAIGYGDKEHVALVNHLTSRFVDSSSTSDEPYLDNTVDELRLNIYKCLSLEGLKELAEEDNGSYYYLLSDETMNYWISAHDNFYKQLALGKSAMNDAVDTIVMDSVLEACRYYFKECYADAMTIALLQLKPAEYLNLVKTEVNILFDYSTHYNPLTPDDDWKIRVTDVAVSLAQRFAIVMFTCNQWEENIKYFGQKECAEAIYNLKVENQGQYREFAQILDSCYKAICGTAKMPEGNSYLPPAALECVKFYLNESLTTLFQYPPRLSTPYCKDDQQKSYTLEMIADDFDKIIRNGDMFGERFYDLIYEHHADVREKVELSNSPTR